MADQPVICLGQAVDLDTTDVGTDSAPLQIGVEIEGEVITDPEILKAIILRRLEMGHAAKTFESSRIQEAGGERQLTDRQASLMKRYLRRVKKFNSVMEPPSTEDFMTVFGLNFDEIDAAAERGQKVYEAEKAAKAAEDLEHPEGALRRFNPRYNTDRTMDERHAEREEMLAKIEAEVVAEVRAKREEASKDNQGPEDPSVICL